MKVALISHEGGGISSLCYGLASRLAQREVEVTIFSSKAGFTTQVQELNDYFKIVRSPMFDFPPNQISYQAFNLLNLSKIFRTYDIVHGVSPDASFMFALLRRKLETPFVGSIHSSPRAGQRAFISQPLSTWTLSEIGFHVVEYPLREFSVDRILRGSNHTILCSYSLLEDLRAYKKLNLNKLSVIHNGIDFDEIESTPILQARGSTELSIMYAGRLFWFKGVMLLLEAFKRLRKSFSNANLRIFGKGPLEEKIKSFIAKSGLVESVGCFGHVSHRRLLVEIKKSDVAVFPSLSEAQPMFVLEAMACKKPVVLFDLPFAREIVSDKNSGLLAESGDVYDLCEKMQLLLSDADLRKRLGENAYSQVKKEHDWNIQVEKYLKVYQNAAN
jgi:glycosyltransferase involved in cell wall biosynthesis